LAALTVAAYHSLEVFKFTEKDASLRRLLFNLVYGPGAVFVFFILSGFVLGLTLNRKKPGDLSACLNFLKRRFFRLFPVMFFSFIVYYIYYRFAYPIQNFKPVTDWFDNKPDISLGEVAKNICLISTSKNRVTWSLRVEWLFSLLLPLVYFWIGKSWRANTVMLGLLVLVFFFLGFDTFHLDPLETPWAYLFMCYSGYMVAILQRPLSNQLSRLLRSIFYALIVIALGICFSTPHFGNYYIPYSIAAVFLIGVIALNVAPSFFKALDSKVLILLGDISYSFYLFNPIFIMMTTFAVLKTVSSGFLVDHLWIFTFVLWMGSSVLTVPLAYFSFCLCERPFTSARYKKATEIVTSAATPRSECSRKAD
jgi:peptidoglycan/LPS O-acetylase OafA/YrhL